MWIHQKSFGTQKSGVIIIHVIVFEEKKKFFFFGIRFVFSQSRLFRFPGFRDSDSFWKKKTMAHLFFFFFQNLFSFIISID